LISALTRKAYLNTSTMDNGVKLFMWRSITVHG